MRPIARNCLLATANILIPVAVITFATGFFPYKPFVPGLGQYQLSEYGNPPEPHFDKVIFMVVDALRSDFVYAASSGFKFTQSLIRSGVALPFTAHATSPTITMPRVKAITTGSIPSFLDVILNFAESDTSSSLASQDTWLAQIKNKNDGKLVMYGDDTWLKLFPDTFLRADGTSSFFVSDFTEVDNNVTRHVPHELRADDWDAMILHYLGLDHIGHKAGPLSPNMVPKQQEMDGVVEEIYSAMRRFDHLKNTLLVMCGDHGMNDGGNHGGSAPGETSPALVFISPKLKLLSPGRESPTLPQQDYEYYSVVEQSDIAPTLAGLLGFPIPQNNLGVFIIDFLPLWKSSFDQRNILLGNALQVWKIVKAAFSSETFGEFEQTDCETLSSSGAELSCLWQRATPFLSHGKQEIENGGATDDILASLTRFTRRAQDVMSSTASNYDVSRLVSGVILVSLSLTIASIVLLGQSTSRQPDHLFFLLITVLYGIMMFASSYVEEEQHFWYWITGGWIACLAIRKPQKLYMYSAGLLLCHRIIQRWNQTGQKLAGAPDIVHDVMMTHPFVLWILIIATYSILLYRIGKLVSYHLKAGVTVGTACALMLCLPALAFKLGFTARDAPELLSWLGPKAVSFLKQLPLVGSARLIFLTIGSEILWALCSRLAHSPDERITRRDLISTVQTLFTLFFVTQTRATNIPLYITFILQDHFFTRLKLTPAQITISTLLLGQSSFFALGNSNAISSIDLSNAYNGISGFNVVGVGILTFLSNWAGPVWWSITAIKMLIDTTSPLKEIKEPGKKKDRDWVKQEFDNLLPKRPQQQRVTTSKTPTPFIDHVALLTFFTSASLLAVMVACTVLRTHLFIWTVFSPKYLFAMAWSLAFHLLISYTIPPYHSNESYDSIKMAKLNGGPKIQTETAFRRNPTRGAAAKATPRPEDSDEDEPKSAKVEDPAVMSAPKGKGKGRRAAKSMPPHPAPAPGASEQLDLEDLMSIPNDLQHSPVKCNAMSPPETPVLTKGPAMRASTPAVPVGRRTRAHSNALETLKTVAEQAEVDEMDEEDAPMIANKPKPAVKKPTTTTRMTRAKARAESEAPQELMVVSAYVEDADMDENEAPQVAVKPKGAAKKQITLRKTRGQNALSQIAEAASQEEEFFDAEVEPVKIKTEDVESEVEEEQVQEPVQPAKKRGRPAMKALNKDMIVEEATQALEELVKPKSKRGRKPTKKTQPPKIKQEEIEDSENDDETLDQKLAGLSLGQMTVNGIEEPVGEVKPKSKARGRARKNTQNKKNGGSLDTSGLELALTYFAGIRDLAVEDSDDESMQKIVEMAKQGMETMEAALATAQQE